MLPINQYLIGDCLEIMKDWPDECVDLIVTDPPYGINYKTNRRKDKDHEFCTAIAGDEGIGWLGDCLGTLYRLLRDDTAIYVFTSHDMIDQTKPIFSKVFNYKNTITWVKNSWTAGDLDCQFGKQTELILYGNKGKAKIRGLRDSDVWYADRVVGEEQYHQNQKPLNLIRKCVEKHSQYGLVVLDPFAGSGTTAVACTELNRNWICIDIEPKYHDIAINRLKGATIELGL